MLGTKGITSSARVGGAGEVLESKWPKRHTSRYSVFPAETECPAPRKPGSTTGRLDRKLSHLTNPNGVAAALNGGARVDRGLTPRCSGADACFWFAPRRKEIVRRPGEDIAGAELDPIVNLAATAATQP
jgi:hypothetical protein